MPNGTSGGVGGSEVQTRSLPDSYGYLKSDALVVRRRTGA